MQGKKQNISMQKEFGQYDEKLVKIIEKSTELFGEYGVRNLNMDEISKGIGISKKTLYQFVCSKEDLLEKIFHYEEEKWQQLPSKIKEDELNAIDVLLQTSLLIYEELRRINPKVDFELKKYYKPVFNKFLSRRLDSIFFYISNNLKKGMGEGLKTWWTYKTKITVRSKIFPLSRSLKPFSKTISGQFQARRELRTSKNGNWNFQSLNI